MVELHIFQSSKRKRQQSKISALNVSEFFLSHDNDSHTHKMVYEKCESEQKEDIKITKNDRKNA